jgi:hypothetical protein
MEKMTYEQLLHDYPMFCLDSYVRWLNYGGPAAADFRKLTDLATGMARDETIEPERRQKARMAWSRKTLPLWRKIARQYPIVDDLVLSIKPGDPPFVSSSPLRERLRTHDLAACFAIGHFREILTAGLLSNMGRCQLESCGRYFYGRAGKLFCSEKCMRKNMRRTPQFRKRNARDQRKHYDKYFRNARRKPRGPESKQTRRRKSG